ncbi:MAG: glycerate kinase [Christensenellaceae bacterium]|jgi:glycerate kinase|nr:glycerate kinase [Christensenellaceae bacterium]
MKKALLVPDSFKGTLSSAEICSILRERILLHFPAAEVVSVPVADGGEGSVDAFLAAMGGEKRTLPVCGPFPGEEMRGFYGLVDGGLTAVVEMAACAGLPLVGKRLRPDQTTTYGVGQLIADALSRGVTKLILGLGGSATNDMGCGAAAALGARFFDETGTSFLPTGGTLSAIRHIDLSGLNPALYAIEFIAMCDVDNPLCGPRGAAAVFGPQKGASEALVRLLDGGLRAAAGTVKQDLGIDLIDMPGAGAAGGFGYGAAAFLGAKLQMGIDTVLETVGFDHLVQGADYVFSGEGKLDSQSLRGKVVLGVARAAKRRGVPVIAIVGDIADGIEAVYGEGVIGVFSTNRQAMDFSSARKRAKKDLSLTADNLMRFLSKIEG